MVKRIFEAIVSVLSLKRREVIPLPRLCGDFMSN